MGTLDKNVEQPFMLRLVNEERIRELLLRFAIVYNNAIDYTHKRRKPTVMQKTRRKMMCRTWRITVTLGIQD
jgi:hypothetical protein